MSDMTYQSIVACTLVNIVLSTETTCCQNVLVYLIYYQSSHNHVSQLFTAQVPTRSNIKYKSFLKTTVNLTQFVCL